MSSRLFQRIREEAGLAYSVGSGLSFLSDTGLLSIQMGVAPEQGREALRLLRNELEQLVAPGEIEKRPLLSSLRYQPAEGELSADALALPWELAEVPGSSGPYVVGELARVRMSRLGELVLRVDLAGEPETQHFVAAHEQLDAEHAGAVEPATAWRLGCARRELEGVVRGRARGCGRLRGRGTRGWLRGRGRARREWMGGTENQPSLEVRTTRLELNQVGPNESRELPPSWLRHDRG